MDRFGVVAELTANTGNTLHSCNTTPMMTAVLAFEKNTVIRSIKSIIATIIHLVRVVDCDRLSAHTGRSIFRTRAHY